jgi:hypothetical protein
MWAKIFRLNFLKNTNTDPTGPDQVRTHSTIQNSFIAGSIVTFLRIRSVLYKQYTFLFRTIQIKSRRFGSKALFRITGNSRSGGDCWKKRSDPDSKHFQGLELGLQYCFEEMQSRIRSGVPNTCNLDTHSNNLQILAFLDIKISGWILFAMGLGSTKIMLQKFLLCSGRVRLGLT